MNFMPVEDILSTNMFKSTRNEEFFESMFVMLNLKHESMFNLSEKKNKMNQIFSTNILVVFWTTRNAWF